MRWILCLAMLVSLGFAPAPVYRPKPSDKDLDLLQGRWIFVSSKDDEKTPTREEGRYIVVRGSALEFQDCHGERTGSYRITLHATMSQRSLQMQDVGRAIASETPYLGLYRIRGDEFVLCFCPTRGKVATSIEGGQGMRRLVFERTANR